MSSPTQLTNRNKPRSKNGCLTCRVRKVKCDEQRPICQRCTNRPIKCEWLDPGRSLSLSRARNHKSPVLGPGSSSNSPRRLAPSSPTAGADRIHVNNTHESRDSKTQIDTSLLPQFETDKQQTLRPTLSTNHLPLSNSLHLSADDQAAFLYIPDSIMVLYYGKLWKWSCFSYVYTNIASRYPGVMRSFIAVGAMELRSRELLAAQDGNDSIRSRERAQRIGAAAAVHYSLALKELSSLLDHVCHSEKQNEDIDALFTMWFLILRFEACDSESKGSSLVHLEGIRSFLTPYLKSNVYTNGEKLPYVSQPMLLYTLYLDADSAAGNVNGGRLCVDLISRDANDFISHENLFHSVRSVLPKIWGERYPVPELLDDMENYRPLRLFHLCQGAKLELRRLVRTATRNQDDAISLRKLGKYIQNFGDEFSDILLLAKLVPDSGGKRLIWTVYSATLDFYALQVLYSCLYPDDEAQSWVESTLSEILAIASKALSENPRQIYRFMWALSVALCKTQGHATHPWLSSQLDRARVLLPNFGIPDWILLNRKLMPG